MTTRYLIILPTLTLAITSTAIISFILYLDQHTTLTYALSNHRTIRINTLHDVRWQRQFVAWRDFMDGNDDGDEHIPMHKISQKENVSLKKWVYRQKRSFRDGTLRDDRMHVLMENRFFDNIESDAVTRTSVVRMHDDNEMSWNEMIQVLREYKENHSEIELLSVWCKGGIVLNQETSSTVNEPSHDYTRLVQQIRLYIQSNRRLSTEKLNQLNDIGVEMNVRKAQWRYMYLRLQTYRNSYGNCIVPSEYDNELFNWVKSQRRLYRKRLRGDQDCLSDERFSILKEIGIHQHRNENYMRWEDYYSQLCDLLEQKGDMGEVEKGLRCDYSNTKLLRWIYRQRGDFRKKCKGEDSPLTDERYKRLIELDFSADKRKSWDDRYDELCEFVAINGHFNVTRAENLGLSQWVSTMKISYRTSF